MSELRARRTALVRVALTLALLGGCHGQIAPTNVCYPDGTCLRPDGTLVDRNDVPVVRSAPTHAAATGNPNCANPNAPSYAADPNCPPLHFPGPPPVRPSCHCPVSATDSDGDCIPDVAERGVAVHSSDPHNPDSDGDGIPDGCEDKNHNGNPAGVDLGETDPSRADSDGDGLPDGLEDANHDGYWDVGETNPTRLDTDGDGIADGVEDADHDGAVRAWVDVDHDGCFTAGVDLAGESDPRLADTDGDQIPDGREDKNASGTYDPAPALHETLAFFADSDCDGLPDGREDLDHDGNLSFDETDPRSVDTDGDGLADGVEDADRNGHYDVGRETSPLLVDSDGDGIADGREDANHNGVVDAYVDANGNGCWDAGEAAGESDPRRRDSDGDGLPDGLEDVDQDGTCAVMSLPDPLHPSAALRTFVETCAFLADTDCDGLADGLEDRNANGARERGETDPRRADSDFDGLADGCHPLHPGAACEDKNNSGARDAGETDPTMADTDGDLLPDGCEAGFGPAPPAGGTNPLSLDSDGDGYADGDEDANHNCRRDYGETDPRVYDPPPGSGTASFPQWSVCSPQNLNGLTYAVSARPGQDYQLALEVEKARTGSCPGGNSSACPAGQSCIEQSCVLTAAYSLAPYGRDVDGGGIGVADANDQLYGYVFQSPQGIVTDPVTGTVLSRDIYGFLHAGEGAAALDDQLDALRSALAARYPDAQLLELGNLPQRPAFDSRPPSFPVNFAQRSFSLTFPQPRTALALRNDLLQGQFLGGVAPDPAGVLPSADPVYGTLPSCNFGTPHCYTSFRIGVGVVQRPLQPGPGCTPSALTIVALTPDDGVPATPSAPQNRFLADRLTRIEDLTGGSALAHYGAGVGKGCAGLPQTQAQADMLWVVDDSRSMQQLISRLQQAAQAAQAALSSNAGIVNLRVGMTTTNPSPAARTQCPAFCDGLCAGSALCAQGCADTALGCIKPCPPSCAGESCGSAPVSCTCSSCSGTTAGAPDLCSANDANALCFDANQMAAAVAADAAVFHLPGGGGTFYYEDTDYLDCDSSLGNGQGQIAFLNQCGRAPYFSARMAPFFGPGAAPRHLTAHAGMLASDANASCSLAPLDLYFNTADPNDAAPCGDAAHPCCQRLTAPCTDGPQVLASQMCDLIRAMGGVPGYNPATQQITNSARRHSSPEMGTRSARRLLTSMLPALPRNYDPAQDSNHYDPKAHLRLSCVAAGASDPNCHVCDPRTDSVCPLTPLATVFLSDEEDFYFKDDCAANQVVADKQQLPSGCRYADPAHDPNTVEACSAAYCAQFAAGLPTGYAPDQAAATSDGFSTLQWRSPSAPQCSPASPATTCLGDPCPALTQAQCGCAPGDAACAGGGSAASAYPFCYWMAPTVLECDSDAKCSEASCATNADCAAGYTCQSGACTYVCDPNAPAASSCPSGYGCSAAGRCAAYCNTAADCSGGATCDRHACANAPALREPGRCAGNACAVGCDPTGHNPAAGMGCPAGASCTSAGICAHASGANAGSPVYATGRASGCLNRCALYTADTAINTSATALAQQSMCTADPFCRWDPSQVNPGSQGQSVSAPGACVMAYPLNDCQPCKRYLRQQAALNGGTGPTPLIGLAGLGPVYAIVRDKGVAGFGPFVANTGATDACNGGSITWGRGDGQAYRDLAAATLGRTQDVCAPGYDSFMQLVTSDIATLSQPYPLPDAPIAATLKVGLARPNGDGTVAYLAVPRSRTSGFIYDATNNGIGFKSDPIDGACGGGACSANGVIEASEIAYARTAPTVPRQGDTIYVSYRKWDPLPCGGACPANASCAQVICTAPSASQSCATDAQCPVGNTCAGGSCALACTVGTLIDACVSTPSCGACSHYDAASQQCLPPSNACACHTGGGQSCSPGAAVGCPVGWGCDEDCLCDPLPSCAAGTFRADGTVSGCSAALACCSQLAGAAAALQAECAGLGGQSLCAADPNCRWGSAGPCHYPFAQITSCCPAGLAPACSQDSESGESALICASAGCTDAACQQCYAAGLQCDLNKHVAPQSTLPATAASNPCCFYNPG